MVVTAVVSPLFSSLSLLARADEEAMAALLPCAQRLLPLHSWFRVVAMAEQAAMGMQSTPRASLVATGATGVPLSYISQVPLRDRPSLLTAAKEAKEELAPGALT